MAQSTAPPSTAPSRPVTVASDGYLSTTPEPTKMKWDPFNRGDKNWTSGMQILTEALVTSEPAFRTWEWINSQPKTGDPTKGRNTAKQQYEHLSESRALLREDAPKDPLSIPTSAPPKMSGLQRAKERQIRLAAADQATATPTASCSKPMTDNDSPQMSAMQRVKEHEMRLAAAAQAKATSTSCSSKSESSEDTSVKSWPHHARYPPKQVNIPRKPRRTLGQLLDERRSESSAPVTPKTDTKPEFKDQVSFGRRRSPKSAAPPDLWEQAGQPEEVEQPEKSVDFKPAKKLSLEAMKENIVHLSRKIDRQYTYLKMCNEADRKSFERSKAWNKPFVDRLRANIKAHQEKRAAKKAQAAAAPIYTPAEVNAQQPVSEEDSMELSNEQSLLKDATSKGCNKKVHWDDEQHNEELSEIKVVADKQSHCDDEQDNLDFSKIDVVINEQPRCDDEQDLLELSEINLVADLALDVPEQSCSDSVVSDLSFIEPKLVFRQAPEEIVSFLHDAEQDVQDTESHDVSTTIPIEEQGQVEVTWEPFIPSPEESFVFTSDEEQSFATESTELSPTVDTFDPVIKGLDNQPNVLSEKNEPHEEEQSVPASKPEKQMPVVIMIVDSPPVPVSTPEPVFAPTPTLPAEAGLSFAAIAALIYGFVAFTAVHAALENYGELIHTNDLLWRLFLASIVGLLSALMWHRNQGGSLRQILAAPFQATVFTWKTVRNKIESEYCDMADRVRPVALDLLQTVAFYVEIWTDIADKVRPVTLDFLKNAAFNVGKFSGTVVTTYRYAALRLQRVPLAICETIGLAVGQCQQAFKDGYNSRV